MVSQHLLPSAKPGEKRVLAQEIMFNNSAVAATIRFGNLESLDNTILTSRADGMLTLDEAIRRLFKAGRISRETAERFLTAGTKLS